MNLTYEQIHGALPTLGSANQRRLFEELARMLNVADGGTGPPGAVIETPTSRELNEKWLDANADHYRGQWVALKDGVLIEHSADGKAFVKAVKDSGIERPLLLLLPLPKDLPQVGSWDLILPDDHAASAPIH